MKNTVICLSLFCLLLLWGCVDSKNADVITKDVGQTGQEEVNILVLTDGNPKINLAGEEICKRMGAVMYEMSHSQKEEIQYAVKQSDRILIGTGKKVEELEFSIRNYLHEEHLAGKKISLFLFDREDEDYVESIKEWYPEAELLPFITIDTKKTEGEEWSRINGWLTTVYTGYIR